MTERERTMDALLVAMAKAQVLASHDNLVDVDKSRKAFQAASAKQEDADRNAEEKLIGKQFGPYCPACGENRSIEFAGDDRKCGYCGTRWTIC